MTGELSGENAAEASTVSRLQSPARSPLSVMLRFSLFGFPIFIHWFFWLNTALLSGHLTASSPEQLQALLIWVAAVLVSILIHELGHAFTMRHFGARPHIVLYALGGLAIPDRGFRRGQDIVVSLAGPLVQIAVGLAASFLLGHSRGDAWWIQLFLGDFIMVSIWWGVFNLLPIYPLDGGHVMNSFLGPSFYKITMWTGALLAIALGLYFFTATRNPSIYNLLFFGMLAWQNIQRANGAQPPQFLRPD
jgi:stage IV sporulation protein FB